MANPERRTAGYYFGQILAYLIVLGPIAVVVFLILQWFGVIPKFTTEQWISVFGAVANIVLAVVAVAALRIGRQDSSEASGAADARLAFQSLLAMRQEEVRDAPVIQLTYIGTDTESEPSYRAEFMVTCASGSPALDVRLNLRPKDFKDQPGVGPATTSRRVPVLAPGEQLLIGVEMRRFEDRGGRHPYRQDWIEVGVECYGRLGAHVLQLYDWSANQPPVSSETSSSAVAVMVFRSLTITPPHGDPVETAGTGTAT